MPIEEKHWDKSFEEVLYRRWKEEKAYAFREEKGRPVFSIDTPPPYVNTPVHIGQAATYVLMDMFARYRRMTGYSVVFPLGLDRNGLPIEMAAEKKFGVRLTELPREKALEQCESILKEASMASTEAFLRSGISFNSWEQGEEIGGVYYTDSASYRALTQATFIDLWKKGLIYEDERITNYCPGCQTTIADAEIEYEELPTVFNDVKFRVKETGEDIIIGTTRPELICTCGMVIFNPEDKRYKRLGGKTAITPVFNKEVPIKAHPMAELGKGTGLAMMCSAGDLNDIRFFRDMNLQPVIAINKDGTMNGHAGVLKGLQVKKAREKIIELLKEKGLLVKQTNLMHRTPVCERSKDAVEFVGMPEFYLKQLEFKPKMLRFAEKINFFAPESRQIFVDWVNSLSIDWPISRRRYYATEIPLWYCGKCKEPILPPKGKYYRPWKEQPPKEALKSGKCPKCGGTEFKGEERVFDTWFDSSISPLYILGYERNPAFFKKNTPCSLRPQGKEIVRTWLYYTVLKDYLLTGECIFRDAWINYHIVDESGEKMSKSKGNVIDPKEVLDRFGAEPFRLWAATEGNLEKTDFRCSFERIEGSAKTLTKLWNVARFISGFKKKEMKKQELWEIDKWILKEMNEIARFTRDCYEQYDFHNPAIRIKSFLWNEFASHYLEMAKSRAYNNDGAFSEAEQQAAVFTLNHCLDTTLLLLAPITPFITGMLFEKLHGKDIHKEEFPQPKKELAFKLGFESAELMELNSAVWAKKKEAGIPLNKEIEEIAISGKLKALERALKDTHRAKKIIYRD